jgi:hypothetical protein
MDGSTEGVVLRGPPDRFSRGVPLVGYPDWGMWRDFPGGVPRVCPQEGVVWKRPMKGSYVGVTRRRSAVRGPIEGVNWWESRGVGKVEALTLRGPLEVVPLCRPVEWVKLRGPLQGSSEVSLRWFHGGGPLVCVGRRGPFVCMDGFPGKRSPTVWGPLERIVLMGHVKGSSVGGPLEDVSWIGTRARGSLEEVPRSGSPGGCHFGPYDGVQ